MTYSKNGDYRILLIIQRYRIQKGKGLGKKLVHHAVNYARKEYKILPLCPFARRVFQQTKIYMMLLSQKHLSFY